MADVKPSVLKKTIQKLGVGVALGVLVACLAGPRMISFWYQPPSKDAFSCAGSVEKALSDFILLQLICAGVGALGVWLIVFFGARLLRGKGGKPVSP